MRLDKLLTHTGFGTRKSIKPLLKSGQVLVNQTIQKDGKFQVNPEKDMVVVSGEQVHYQEFIYLMLNKPQGVISATEDREHETVIDLLDQRDCVLAPFPVGRLDKDTEGLLLLTNDGTLSHQLLSPKKHVDKCYLAKVRGEVTATDIDFFANGVTLKDGYTCKAAQLSVRQVVDGYSDIEVIIQEGKYHQVKRMFEACGKQVLYLKRISMGTLQLDETLELGAYRALTDEELTALKNS
ncbi:pseudouridine synthase [Isobaculum melis]|uniref:Pseudouridine synthase n=1 Tax=Isobaculum melis TaxID=142588 RepID=A0A1H9UI42_9LACT|nr:pseudouridine synthase [Isobaculum melis]SES08948.1 ribosomal small subunit pseudouridine synthase A [Isobaculum melis]